ncbi:hypothetical protein LTS09_013185 [Friedmanniomyces endolithicus]|nr:hypothetical protein LTS09_013185 [Friedmanniomyces endolithicus]
MRERNLRKQALESGKTQSRKARETLSTPSSSRATSAVPSPRAGGGSNVPSRNVSDDESEMSDATQWSTNSIDEMLALPAEEDGAQEEAWRAALEGRIEELCDRKRSSAQGREEALLWFSTALVRHYAADEVRGRREELVVALLKSVKGGQTERETVLALKALALVLVTEPSDTLCEALAGPMKACINDAQHVAEKIGAIHALGVVTFFGGASGEATAEVMDFFLDIISSDGAVIEEADNADIVTAALEEWGFLATQLEDMEETTEAAMETFVDQLESASVDVQVAAGDNIALLFEKSYTEAESDDEPPDEDENLDEDVKNGSAPRMIKRYTVYRQQHQLSATLSDLAKASSKRLSKKDRKQLHLSFADIARTVERPTRGPRYSTALDEEGREMGSRLKVALHGGGRMTIDRWWKLHRLNGLKRLLREGFLVHYEFNQVVYESLPVVVEDDVAGYRHTILPYYFKQTITAHRNPLAIPMAPLQGLTFGVEIEVIAAWPRTVNPDHLIPSPLKAIYSQLTSAGVPVTLSEPGWEARAANFTHWQLKTDLIALSPAELAAFPRGSYTSESVELASRRFDFYHDDWRGEIKRVLQVLSQLEQNPGARFFTNASTGLHVHVADHDRGLPLRAAKNLLQLATAFERCFDALHAANRIAYPRVFSHDGGGNSIGDFWCAPLSWFHRANGQTSADANLYDWLAAIEDQPSLPALNTGICGLTEDIAEAGGMFHRTAYGHNSAYNLDNLYPHFAGERYTGTLEFRQHAGTMDYLEVVHWIVLTTGMVRYCAAVEPVPFLTLCAYGVDRRVGLRGLLTAMQCPADTVGYFAQDDDDDDAEAVIGFLGSGDVFSTAAPVVLEELDDLMAHNEVESSDRLVGAELRRAVVAEKDYGFDPAIEVCRPFEESIPRYYAEASLPGVVVLGERYVNVEEADSRARAGVWRRLASEYRGEVSRS